MLVTRVVSPVSLRESWTVLGDDDVPVAPIERYLRYLTDIERSPNTIKAYAHDLKDWFTFLANRGPDWTAVQLEDVGAFVSWLRLPTGLRQNGIVMVPTAAHHCGEATVNRKLSALAAFYTHAARDGVAVGKLLTTWQVGGSRAGWKPFLHHVSKQMPRPRRMVRLKAAKKLPRILTPVEAQAILDSCDRLRDRFLLAVLYDTGMRVGEALGLRHSDIAAAECEISVRRRDNDNGARAKSVSSRTVPVSTELIRLYADYLHDEYGDLDSDTCSSTCGAARMGIHGPMRRSTIWSYACGGALPSTSIRTGCATRRRRGCCATGSDSRSSPSCSAMPMSPPPPRPTGI